MNDVWVGSPSPKMCSDPPLTFPQQRGKGAGSDRSDLQIDRAWLSSLHSFDTSGREKQLALPVPVTLECAHVPAPVPPPSFLSLLHFLFSLSAPAALGYQNWLHPSWAGKEANGQCGIFQGCCILYHQLPTFIVTSSLPPATAILQDRQVRL